MGTIERRLQELGLSLPKPKVPVANYRETKQSGDLLLVSGRVSQLRGEVGTEVSVADAKAAARATVLDLLAIVSRGSAGTVSSIVPSNLQMQLPSRRGAGLEGWLSARQRRSNAIGK